MQKDVHWGKEQQYTRIKAKRVQLMTSWAFNWYIKKHDINTTWNDEKSGKTLLKGSSNVIDHKNHILHFIHVKLFDVWFSYYILGRKVTTDEVWIFTFLFWLYSSFHFELGRVFPKWNISTYRRKNKHIILYIKNQFHCLLEYKFN